MLARTPLKDRLIAWLETQDPNGAYDWFAPWVAVDWIVPDRDPRPCLWGQFCQDTGAAITEIVTPVPRDDLLKIGRDKPWTFGAALARARQLPDELP